MPQTLYTAEQNCDITSKTMPTSGIKCEMYKNSIGLQEKNVRHPSNGRKIKTQKIKGNDHLKNQCVTALSTVLSAGRKSGTLSVWLSSLFKQT